MFSIVAGSLFVVEGTLDLFDAIRTDGRPSWALMHACLFLGASIATALGLISCNLCAAAWLPIYSESAYTLDAVLYFAPATGESSVIGSPWLLVVGASFYLGGAAYDLCTGVIALKVDQSIPTINTINLVSEVMWLVSGSVSYDHPVCL